MVVVVASGLPGAGKSTFFKKLYRRPKIVSADHFFMIDCPLCAPQTISPDEDAEDVSMAERGACSKCHGEGVIYHFEPGQLREAHADCLRKFLEMMNDEKPDYDAIIVDNTNTTAAEIAPYVAIAEAFGHKVIIATLQCDLATSMARNRHDVPETSLRKMADQLANRKLPTYWEHMQLTVEY